MKKISVYRKHVWEHISPDGDKCEFVVMINNNRKYCQFQRYIKCSESNKEEFNKEESSKESNVWKPDGEPFIIDGPFLLDAADAYRNCTSVIKEEHSQHSILQIPQIVDHRQTQSEQIEKEVATSMKNMNDDTKPIHSFVNAEKPENPVDYNKFRTGVDVEAMPNVAKTPDEWALDEQQSNLTQWQKDAIARKQKQKSIPIDKSGGRQRPQFMAKKISASEII